MTLLDPYTWPWMGSRLCRNRRRWGAYIGRRLISKRYSPAQVLRYANEQVSQAAADNRVGDMHEYIGMANAAAERYRSEP